MTRTHFRDFHRIDDEEVIVTVEYSISPYYAATYDDPAEGGEVEIIKAWIEPNEEGAKALEVTLTDAEHLKFSNYIAENHDHDGDIYDGDEG